ncbi:DUF3291 domain-containing protein [uncultured Roseibium sp.]|uniref:DUF3291 domain-containing protein n=1 Tax=uncultured Roseibium sp. TaxID=1936171 RepID=UPI00261DE434|nr:DUF3291 domain-containing protein [uncultured Roseibium sp.]
MQEHKLAVYTFNQFVAPYQSEQISGFREAEPGTFFTLENAEGFIARSGYDGEDGSPSWGEQVFPDCWSNSNGDGWAPSTLSLWSSIEALMAATYQGPHGRVLRHGKDWHVSADHIPEYVLWWVEDGNRPDWTEAVERFETLMAEGPGPTAFTFKNAFDPGGRPFKPDLGKMKDFARQNARRV